MEFDGGFTRDEAEQFSRKKMLESTASIDAKIKNGNSAIKTLLPRFHEDSILELCFGGSGTYYPLFRV